MVTTQKRLLWPQPNQGSSTFSKIKDKDDTKIDAITHFNMHLDFSINGSRDFKCLTFNLFYYYTPLQLKNYMMLNNSEPVILTIDI
jgi:hypothetical protein